MNRISIFILLPLLLFNLVNSCVDVLFVIDTKSAEISKNRAIQVAKQLPEDQKIRKWIAISRQDRYVPRVVRNNNELLSVLSSVSGDYEKFLEVATSEVARRTPTFQPLIILLFSEVAVNQTLSSTWKSISRAPALHIFRIGTSKKREIEETSEFQRLVSCGHNKTFNTGSSKFSGSQNEIRRAPLPSTTSRPFTSTRDPFVRKLTFLNPTKTLLHDKQFTVTRNFRRLATSTFAPTWRSSTPSPTVATVLSAPPPSLKDQFAGGKNFRVRSRSVQFTLTEKPPVVSHRSSVVRTHRTTISPPTTTPFIPPACLIDVYFMIDLSKGTGDKTDKYLQLISSTINQMPISKFAIHAGLIGYSGPGRTRTDVYLDQIYEKKPLIEAMQRMWRNAGTTKTAIAIRYAVREFASKAHPTRKGSKKILVIFTDGYSQDNPKEAAKMARSQGIQIIGVGLDDKLAPPDVDQLKTIAESNVLLSPTGNELRDKIVGPQCRL